MPRLSALALVILPVLAACHRSESAGQQQAKALIAANCAACHIVPGVARAQGRVGPSLAGIAIRQTLAGRLPNTAGNMQQFLLHPQTIQPGGAMPEMELTQDQARVISDYLHTLDTP